MNPKMGFWVVDDGQASTPRTTKKKAKRKIEFDGWGSRELIAFLQSIGKDTTKTLTHFDVTNIVNQYVIDSKLIHPDKKKRVICDEWLQILFGGKKQSVLRNKVHDLLGPHLVANHVASENDSDSSDEDAFSVSKKQKMSTLDKRVINIKKVPEVPKTALVAISSDNIKLVYLKRSLVQQLLKNPDTFESKLVGSFVKVKADRYDIYQKNSHQLEVVKGIKKVAGDGRPPMLQLASMIDDVSISMLSDDNFSEEECEDLRRRIKEGLLKQPTTVGELEEKVAMLHQEITKHWLERELVLLKIRTDQANEKGWRHKVVECLDRRKLLNSPEEQARLLNEIPKVVPEKVEKVEPETILDNPLPDDPPDDVNLKHDPPKADDWEWEACQPTKVSNKKSSQEALGVSLRVDINTRPLTPLEETKSKSETKQIITECNVNFKLIEENGMTLNRIQAPKPESTPPIHKDIPKPETFNCSLTFGQMLQQSKQSNPVTVTNTTKMTFGQLLQHAKQEKVVPKEQKPKQTEIITLSDDEDEEETPIPPPVIKPAFPHPESSVWLYFDPTNQIQGPFPLSSLKRWKELGYFLPDFRVWVSGQSPDRAVLLTDVLKSCFP